MPSHGDEDSVRLSKPLGFASTIIKRPCKILLIIVLAVFIAGGIDAVFFKFTPNSGRSFLLDGSTDVANRDAITKAVDALSENSATRVTPKTQDVSLFNTQVMYETTDGSDILQEKHINSILSVEKSFKSADKLAKYNALCFATTSTAPSCSPNAQFSLYLTAFPSGSITPSGSQNSATLKTMLDNVPALLPAVGSEYASTKTSTVYRSVWRFGLPYPNVNASFSSYANRDDRFDEQGAFFDAYMQPLFEKLQFNTNLEGIRIIVANNRMRQIYFTVASLQDMYWAIASFFAVALCISLHTRSGFVALFSMLQILFSFPLAFFVYRLVFQVTYFDTMDTLVIFILLGIGADDVFVFSDAWVQSEWLAQNPVEGLAEIDDDPEIARLIIRMSFAFRRAAKAMLVTQTTTFFAFLATSFSPLIPISAFGIWAALVIIMNYILVITFFPAILSLWYQKVRESEGNCWSRVCQPCCCGSSQTPVLNKQLSNLEEQFGADAVEMEARQSSAPSSGIDIEASEDQAKNEESERCMERCLRDKFAEVIIKGRYAWLGFFLLLGGAVGFGASNIRPLSREEEWFPATHWIALMFALPEKFYGGSDVALTRLDVAWGIKGIDRKGSNRWDPEDYGNVVFDPTFDLSVPSSQQYIYDICADLQNNRGDLVKTGSLKCFMFSFRTYVENDTNQSFPLVLSSDPAVQAVSFNNFMRTWLATPEGRGFKASGNVGYFGTQNRVEYILLSALAPIVRFGAASKKKVVRDAWDAYLAEKNRLAPSPAIKGAFQASIIGWAWMDSELAFVQSAVQGVAIATPLSFVVLLISTENIIIAIFATSCIGGIVASAMTLMVLFGWELGVTESISIVIMIGFSVDYVVHLGNAYVECDVHDGTKDNRYNRIRFALYTMGISVVSGAVTTIVSGIFLLGATMIFFNKFGILICGTILFSLAWSMFYFLSVLAVCGPNEDCGHIGFLSCFLRCIDCGLSVVRKDEESGSVKANETEARETKEI